MYLRPNISKKHGKKHGDGSAVSLCSHDLHVLEKSEGERDQVLFFLFDEAFGSVAVGESRNAAVSRKAEVLFVLGEDLRNYRRIYLRISLEGERDFTFPPLISVR